MISRTGIGFCILFALVAGFAPGASIDTARADEIVIVADEWCPYNCEPESNLPGYVVELAQTIFGAAGHTVTYEVLPWTRAVRATAGGKFNAVICGTEGEAPGFVFPEQEVAISANHFFVRKGYGWMYEDFNSLLSERIAVISDYDYGEKINAYINDNPRSDAAQVASGESALETNLKKLVHDRVDVVLEDKNVALYTAKELGLLDKIEYAGNDAVKGTVKSDYMYLAFSPKNPKSREYAAIWDKGVADMRANGELAVILANYGVEDWR